jgi:hypothetical protein
VPARAAATITALGGGICSPRSLEPAADHRGGTHGMVRDPTARGNRPSPGVSPGFSSARSSGADANTMGAAQAVAAGLVLAVVSLAIVPHAREGYTARRRRHRGRLHRRRCPQLAGPCLWRSP